MAWIDYNAVLRAIAETLRAKLSIQNVDVRVDPRWVLTEHYGVAIRLSTRRVDAEQQTLSAGSRHRYWCRVELICTGYDYESDAEAAFRRNDLISDVERVCMEEWKESSTRAPFGIDENTYQQMFLEQGELEEGELDNSMLVAVGSVQLDLELLGSV